MITIGGFNLPVRSPVEGDEVFWQNFLKMFDGQAQLVGTSSGQAAAGAVTVTVGGASQVFQWTALAGSTLTLPAATGSLTRIMVYVETLATSLSHIVKTSPATDSFSGIIMGARTDSGNAVLGFAAVVGGGSNSNTITLNRTTTGSVNKGEWVELTDVASGIWHVRGFLTATGAAFATPFSHV